MSESMVLNEGAPLEQSGPSFSLPPNSSEGKGPPGIHHFDILLKAVRCGDTETVRAQIPLCAPGSFKSVALATAARDGHLDIVRLLIPFCDPKINSSSALFLAARNGHADVVRALIPVSEPNANDGDRGTALWWAAFNGHAQVVRELIPVSDPRIKDSEPLLTAAKQGNHPIVSELAPMSDVALVFRSELADAQLNVHQVADPLCIEHSLTAVDALIPYVSESERDRALAELPATVVTRLPRLRAWSDTRALQTCLPPTAATDPSHRCARRCL